MINFSPLEQHLDFKNKNMDNYKERLYFRSMIFVTGGTGLLGSHLLYELTKENVVVKAIFRDESKIENVKKVFDYYSSSNSEAQFQKIIWVQSDILDISSLEEEMYGCEYVYHCAALVSFHKKDYYKLMKINREGTANIVNASLKNEIKKLCYVSSTAAIGGHESHITEESKWKQSPETSGYSISKYSAEKEIWRGVEEGLNAVIVNPCMIIGAGDWNESSMTIFRTIQKGLKFYPSGSNAFVDARDVSEIMVKLIKSEITNQRFLCIGENISFKNVFEKIATSMNTKPPTIAVSKTVMKLAWLISYIISKISGKRAVITKETVNSAFKKTSYSSEKIQNSLDFNFRRINDTITNAIIGKI